MYCKYCGKQTENTNGVCDECAAKDEVKEEKTQLEVAPVREIAPPAAELYGQPLNSSYGVKGGILAIVLGVVCFVLTVGALTTWDWYKDFRNFEVANEVGLLISSIVLMAGATACGAVAIVFGAKAIKNFSEAKARGVRPVATLTLGIIGLAISAFMIFVMLMVLITNIPLLFIG